MTNIIKKAVFPVGGLGTRFLPATKAMPKEMLTVVDKPLIQYAVEEARAAGIEEFIFVTGRGKTVIEDHFDYSYELNDMLTQRGKHAELEAARASMLDAGQVVYTRQQEPLGLAPAGFRPAVDQRNTELIKASHEKRAATLWTAWREGKAVFQAAALGLKIRSPFISRSCSALNYEV